MVNGRFSLSAMTSEPTEVRVLTSAGVKGGALLWIDHHARLGDRVTRAAFLDAFRFRHRSEHFSQDLLTQLESEGLVTASVEGNLSITVNAEQWMHEARFWEQITETLEAGST